MSCVKTSLIIVPYIKSLDLLCGSFQKFWHYDVATSSTFEFDQVSKFIGEHPTELVILDFNHFYHMDIGLHTTLINQLTDM